MHIEINKEIINESKMKAVCESKIEAVYESKIIFIL